MGRQNRSRHLTPPPPPPLPPDQNPPPKPSQITTDPPPQIVAPAPSEPSSPPTRTQTPQISENQDPIIGAEPAIAPSSGLSVTENPGYTAEINQLRYQLPVPEISFAKARAAIPKPAWTDLFKGLSGKMKKKVRRKKEKRKDLAASKGVVIKEAGESENPKSKSDKEGLSASDKGKALATTADKYVLSDKEGTSNDTSDLSSSSSEDDPVDKDPPEESSSSDDESADDDNPVEDDARFMKVVSKNLQKKLTASAGKNPKIYKKR
ncbi:unnamed protein product [Arabis nemorensis]|uniref:Uncharacterized protein n=1 Tax=Arabis nemorensis TaxID=586526 RepID=A0A565BGE1_9BRAS|nr:unnamed protein product [Arabis nemorensis]